MSDERDFHINITGDAGGIVVAGKQGAGALKEIKAEITDGINPAMISMADKTNESGKASERAEVSHRALKMGLRALGPEAAEAGEAIRMVSENSTGAGMVLTAETFILAFAISKVMEHFAKVREALKEGVDISGIDKATAALGDGAMMTALIEGGVAAEEFWNKLNRLSTAQETLKDKTDDATAAIRAQTESENKQFSAKEKAELAELELAKAKGAITDAQYGARKAEIEDRYEGERANAKAIEQDEIIATRKKELEGQQGMVAAGPDMVTAKQLAASKAKGNLEGEKASLQAMEQKLAKLDEYSKKYLPQMLGSEAAGKSLTSQGNSSAIRAFLDMVNFEPGMPVSSQIEKERGLLLRQIEAKKQVTIPKAEVTASGAKDDADEAEKKLADATRRKAELDREIAKLESDRTRDAATLAATAEAHKRERAAEAQTRAYEAFKTPEGKLVQEVSATETALAHGRRISGGEQSQAIAFAQLLRTLGVGNEATVTGLASVHETQAQHNLRLLALVERIKLAEARQRDVYNQ